MLGMARVPKSGRQPSPFGLNLKRIRKARGLTQQQVADLANLERPTVTEIETGGAPNPRTETQLAIAKGLGLPLSEFSRATEPNKLMVAAVRAYNASPYAEIDKPKLHELLSVQWVTVAEWTDREPTPESIHHVLLAIRASQGC